VTERDQVMHALPTHIAKRHRRAGWVLWGLCHRVALFSALPQGYFGCLMLFLIAARPCDISTSPNHAVDATQAAEFRRIASDMMQLAAGAALGGCRRWATVWPFETLGRTHKTHLTGRGLLGVVPFSLIATAQGGAARGLGHGEAYVVIVQRFLRSRSSRALTLCGDRDRSSPRPMLPIVELSLGRKLDGAMELTSGASIGFCPVTYPSPQAPRA
jgi:hypothetical protein